MREELKSGQADIVVGTHALLAKPIEFKVLGLLIIDEEQHFGVGHKERLKQLRERRACADADGYPDPAHAATRADRRPRNVGDRHTARGPAPRCGPSSRRSIQ